MGLVLPPELRKHPEFLRIQQENAVGLPRTILMQTLVFGTALANDEQFAVKFLEASQEYNVPAVVQVQKEVVQDPGAPPRVITWRGAIFVDVSCERFDDINIVVSDVRINMMNMSPTDFLPVFTGAKGFGGLVTVANIMGTLYPTDLLQTVANHDVKGNLLAEAGYSATNVVDSFRYESGELKKRTHKIGSLLTKAQHAIVMQRIMGMF
jgi:hypothetical protein